MAPPCPLPRGPTPNRRLHHHLPPAKKPERHPPNTPASTRAGTPEHIEYANALLKDPDAREFRDPTPDNEIHPPTPLSNIILRNIARAQKRESSSEFIDCIINGNLKKASTLHENASPSAKNALTPDIPPKIDASKIINTFHIEDTTIGILRSKMSPTPLDTNNPTHHWIECANDIDLKQIAHAQTLLQQAHQYYLAKGDLPNTKAIEYLQLIAKDDTHTANTIRPQAAPWVDTAIAYTPISPNPKLKAGQIISILHPILGHTPPARLKNEMTAENTTCRHTNTLA